VSEYQPFNPEYIFRQLNETGDAWVDKNAAAEILEETKKTVLAELMNALEGPKTEREARALADPTYKLHLTNMVTARKEANRARVKYDSMKVLAEMRRTEASTRRAEMMLR
jgi:hypothetical protein